MSEELKPGARNLSGFDTMTTQQLEELLRLDVAAPQDQQSDAETILQITEELIRRNKTNPTGINAHKALESFQQYYLPEIEDGLNGAPKKPQQSKPLRTNPRRWLVAAAVIALLAGIPLAAGALRWDKTRDILATWKEGIFSFAGTDAAQTTAPEDGTPHPYASLQDALVSNGDKTDMVPTWIPDGYVLKDITIVESPLQRIYSATYAKEDTLLEITIRSFLTSNPSMSEINDELVEFYQSAGIDCYIFHNNNHLKAIWLKDSYECIISGILTLDQIKTMIDSIGKG